MHQSFNQRLLTHCNKKKSRLCIGLDIDPDRMPSTADRSLTGLEAFAMDIVEGTIEFCPIYKLNMAFYERFGSRGYALMERIVERIGQRAITIADGKRGDIGNTTRQYARAIFKTIGFDAITVSPYMGRDSILPFIESTEKGAFILCLTSNASSADFQFLKFEGKPLYQHLAQLALELNDADNVGLVVGATQPERMQELRELSKGLSWLIPGIGAQGGDLQSSIEISNTAGTGFVNVSRGILYAGNGSIQDVIGAAEKYTSEIRKLI